MRLNPYVPGELRKAEDRIRQKEEDVFAFGEKKKEASREDIRFGQEQKIAGRKEQMSQWEMEAAQRAKDMADKIGEPMKYLDYAGQVFEKAGGNIAVPFYVEAFSRLGLAEKMSAAPTHATADPRDPSRVVFLDASGEPVLGPRGVVTIPRQVSQSLQKLKAGESLVAGSPQTGYETVAEGPEADVTAKKPADVGTIPAGHRLLGDKAGGYSMEAIPGSPAEAKKKAAEEKRKAREKQTSTEAQFAVQDINRAISIIDDPEGVLPATGMTAYLSKHVPGTGAYDLDQVLESVRANVGFKQLTDMRNASPTGGALGQVSDRENKLLQAIKGTLVTSVSPAIIRDNLLRLKELFLDAWYGTEAERQEAVLSGLMTAEEAGALARERETAGLDVFQAPQQTTPERAAQAGAPQPQQEAVKVQTPEEAMQLPVGTVYETPDGQRFRR
jgi:hypothetical protein